MSSNAVIYITAFFTGPKLIWESQTTKALARKVEIYHWFSVASVYFNLAKALLFTYIKVAQHLLFGF